MSVVVLSCVYPPEPVVSSQTSQQIAEGLVGRGFEVKVIAPFPSRPAGKAYKGYTRRLYRSEQEGNITILRCFSLFSRHSTLLSRFSENISFGISSACALMTMRRPQLVYINTWPLFAMGMAVMAARMRRIPVVLSIQDIYPETLVNQGRLGHGSVVARILERLDRFVVGRAASVVVISESFRKIYLHRGVPASRLHLVPNWLDEQSINPDANGKVIREKLGIPKEAFLTVYAGNIATAAGVETAIEAFAQLKDQTQMYFCIAGEGANLDNCRLLARQLGCERIRLYTPWPVEETSDVLTAADLLLLPTHGAQSTASVPSKLIAYMLAARPVLALVIPESDVASTVGKAGAGWSVNPGDVASLSKSWLEIAQLERATLHKFGDSARRYALANMTDKACLPELLNLIEKTRSV